MLRSLHIENFAIVDQLHLQLETGLTIITGETGAGKSILIDALSLVLGERADSSVVRQGCDATEIQAVFTVPKVVNPWLQQQGIPPQDNGNCLVYRVINSNGRSRATVNHQPVSNQILRELSEYLIDIHGQHAHQSLLKQEVQRQLLDDLADDKRVLHEVIQAYEHWKTLKNELDRLGGITQNREAKLALLRYQVQELEGLDLTAESLQHLEEEHRRLANASKLLENSQRALTFLDSDSSTLACLNQASHALNEVLPHDTRLQGVNTLLDNAIIHAQEAVRELRNYLNQLDIDPTRLQATEQRIATLQDLARKHKVRFSDLPAYFQQLTTQLQELENYEQRAKQLDSELTIALQTYWQAAGRLHEQRGQIGQQLAEHISTNMRQLGMPAGYLVISVIADAHAIPAPTGTDIVEFLVTTNPGYPPRPLHKVASGGELSRISLAIQVITAQRSGVPTLVFDEVDVGIGGGVAEIVGQLLRRLGQQRQVLCITHLPQVACQGHYHLQVSKITQQATTHTSIALLNKKQRVKEIARMLGGVEITPQTLAHAEEMLQRGVINN